MADLSAMSDDDLMAAYGQAKKSSDDLAALSDHDLMNRYQQAQNQSAPTGTVDEYGTPLPGSSPENDAYLANSGIGKVLDAFGHGAKQGWGTEPAFSPVVTDALKKAGIFNDAEKGQTSIVRGFNEALLRPAAAALDAINSAGWAAYRAVPAAIGGFQAAAAETGEQAGAPQLGRDIAALPEAFPLFGEETGGLHGVPPNLAAARSTAIRLGGIDLERAQAEGVLGTEAEWKGIAPPTDDFPVGSVSGYSAQSEIPGGTALQPYQSALSPDVPAIPQPIAPAVASAPDLDAIARQTEPDLFTKRDALLDRADSLRKFIDSESNPTPEMFDDLASKQSQVEAALGAANPRSPDAANYRAQLADIETQRQDLTRRQEAWGSENYVEPPQVMMARQHLADTNRDLMDMGPTIAAARRRAADHAGVPEETAVTEVPASPSQEVPPTTAQGEPIISPSPAIEGTQPATTPNEQPAPKSLADQRAFITADQTDRLVAAGMPREQAEVNAHLQAAYYETLSQRFGGRIGTPEELYRERAARVIGPNGEAPPTPIRQPAVAPTSESAQVRQPETVGAPAQPAAEGGAQPGPEPSPELVSAAPEAPPAPEPGLGPRPRIRTATEIAQQEGIAATKANGPRILAIQEQDIAALADWQARQREMERPAEAVQQAPAPTSEAPPALRSEAQIIQQDRVTPAVARETWEREVQALAAWQDAHPQPVRPKRIRAPLLPTAAEPVLPAHTEASGNGGLESLDPASIGVDADRFQFKSGADEAGVTDRLQGVQTWDPRLAGTALVFRDAEGKNWIADGHQRLALAQRLASEGQSGIRLNAFVLDAKDGISDVDARSVAAAKNIAEGSGTALDAAKVIRQAAETGIELPPLPPRSTLVRDGRALARLGPDAFGMAVNDVVPLAQATAVGRLVSDHAQQAEAVRVLAKAKPDNARQAELIIRDMLESGTENAVIQGGLFGDEHFAASAVLERAKVADEAMRQLTRDRTTFRTLVNESDRIQSHGANTLDLEANQIRLSGDEQAKQLLTQLATRKGPVSDALTGIARRLKSGDITAAAGAREFLAVIRSHVEGELGTGADVGRTVAGAAGERELTQTSPATETAKAPASPVDSKGNPAKSWVVVNKATGEVVMETFEKKTADAINKDKYDAVPVLDHLAGLNAKTPRLEAPATDLLGRPITEPVARTAEPTIRSDERQIGLPGTEPSAIQAQAARDAEGPREGQKPADEGLFARPEDEQKSLFQRASAAIQGRIRIMAGDVRSIITLARTSDASTFMHETGHDWLKQLMQDSQHPLAPDELKADAATIRRWLKRPEDWTGFKANGAPDVVPQEKFARGFEQYLREGVAPSPGLARIFQQFKSWLTTIYRTLKGLGAPISDDIRGVFDRMLAIEPERTTYTEDAERQPSLATIHETDAAETEPRQAEAVGDRIVAERDQQIAERKPEIANELGAAANESAGETGTGQGGLGEVDGGSGQSEPIPRSGGGSAGSGAVEPGGDNAVPKGTELPSGAAAGEQRSATPEPKPVPVDVKTEAPEFTTKEDREIEKAANIRLDKMNSTAEMDDAWRALAQQNGDFMDARYGTVAYQTQMEIKNTRILLRLTTSDLIDAAKKAQSMDPAAIADMLVKEQRAAMVFSRLSTLSADWAHAGHELNKVMDGWEATKEIASKIAENRDLFQRSVAQRVAAYASMDTPEQAAKFASDILRNWGSKTKDIALSLFINNLISGPITHMAYMTGNTVMSLYRAAPLTAYQATFGAIRQALSADDIIDRVYFREIVPQLYGMYKGARDGIEPAYRAWKTGVPELAGGAQADLAVFQNVRTQVIPGMAGRILEAPSRMVAALHTFSYSMSYSQEIARLAARDAAARGLTGDAFNAEVARLTSSPTSEMMENASTAGLHGTLMTRPTEGFQKDLVAMTNKYWPLKLAIPFMQIGTNILKEGLIDQTALSMLSSEARSEAMGLRGGAARDIRLGKIAAGASLSLATLGMAAEGMMTGSGPSEPNKRRVWLDAGNLPYSIRIGNLNIPYRKITGPLGPLLAASSDMYEVGHTLSEQGLTQASTALAFSFAEVVADESWMSGVSNLVGAVQDRGGAKTEQYLRSLATSFIPFSVGASQVARMVDPYQRQARTILDAAINKIPFASETLEPQIGIWGQKIGSRTAVSPTSPTNDPVDARLQALGFGVSAIERKVVGIPLTDQQYTRLAITSGMLTHQILTAMVTAPGFAQLPAGIQTKAIQEKITQSRETARALIKQQDAAQSLQTGQPSIIQRATQNKLKLRTDGHAAAAY